MPQREEGAGAAPPAGRRDGVRHLSGPRATGPGGARGRPWGECGRGRGRGNGGGERRNVRAGAGGGGGGQGDPFLGQGRPGPPQSAGLMKIGAHVKTSGGVEKAIDRAEEMGAEAIQIFSGAPQAWRRKEDRPGGGEGYRGRAAGAGGSSRRAGGPTGWSPSTPTTPSARWPAA